MESKKTLSEVAKNVENSFLATDELANLKRVSEVDNNISLVFRNLIVCNANEGHVKEVAELWANLASIQQIFAPERYNFKLEGKDWQLFVRKKIEKKNNLLLVTHNKNESEVKGFLYLQTITLPSSDLILKGVIEDIYTKPQHRKQDIASTLLNVSLEWALSQNVKQVDLISLTKARDLSQFYLSFLKALKSTVNLELVEA